MIKYNLAILTQEWVHVENATVSYLCGQGSFSAVYQQGSENEKIKICSY